MSKTYRAWEVDQAWLLPPSVHDFVPAGHPAHLIRELVRLELGLSAILAMYERELRGFPPYHPAMMVALLLYGYSRGVYSSRKLARACEERLDFMAVTALQRPDFRTISDFRKRHVAALAGLFAQVLTLCREAGLVKLGHVALDGTKVKAKASRHKAMSYGRMKQRVAELEAEGGRWLAQAERADAAEDAEHGERRGDEMPAWLADKQRPTRRSTTSAIPDSRVLKTRDGFVQGYNGQIAVDGHRQIITAQRLTTNGADHGALAPLLEDTTRRCGRKPKAVSADAGFCNEDNLAAAASRRAV